MYAGVPANTATILNALVSDVPFRSTACQVALKLPVEFVVEVMLEVPFLIWVPSCPAEVKVQNATCTFGTAAFAEVRTLPEKVTVAPAATLVGLTAIVVLVATAALGVIVTLQGVEDMLLYTTEVPEVRPPYLAYILWI